MFTVHRDFWNSPAYISQKWFLWENLRWKPLELVAKKGFPGEGFPGEHYFGKNTHHPLSILEGVCFMKHSKVADI